jgi:ElaB/YqjD/DUF883 family membrane-anchored ribosome-binding protein
MKTSISQDTSSPSTAAEAMNSLNSSKAEANKKASQAGASVGEALEQMRAATHAIYEAFGAMGSASGGVAKLKMNESRDKLTAASHRAESTIAEKPLLYVGCAFAAGWLVSRLMK